MLVAPGRVGRVGQGRRPLTRVNLLKRSQEFDAAIWTKSQTVVTANAIAAPDGTTTAEFLRENAATGGHQVTQSVTTTAIAHTLSIHAKAGTRSWLALALSDSGGTVRVSYFNIGTGAVGSVASGCTAAMEALADGWYRPFVTVAAALAGSNTARCYLTTGDGATTYTGDDASGLYLWGAQLEPFSSVGPYIATAG